jgi:hypothetical protein
MVQPGGALGKVLAAATSQSRSYARHEPMVSIVVLVRGGNWNGCFLERLRSDPDGSLQLVVNPRHGIPYVRIPFKIGIRNELPRFPSLGVNQEHVSPRMRIAEDLIPTNPRRWRKGL